MPCSLNDSMTAFWPVSCTWRPAPRGEIAPPEPSSQASGRGGRYPARQVGIPSEDSNRPYAPWRPSEPVYTGTVRLYSS